MLLGQRPAAIEEGADQQPRLGRRPGIISGLMGLPQENRPRFEAFWNPRPEPSCNTGFLPCGARIDPERRPTPSGGRYSWGPSR